MITAEQVGRNLHITVEGVEPAYVVRPLPGRAAIQITDTYLAGASGAEGTIAITEALQIAFDGGVFDPEAGVFHAAPEDAQPNFARASMELSLTETNSVLLAAFFWQTLLGIDGVNEFIRGGEGVAGTVKALRALVQRTGHFALLTSPSSESVDLTSEASTPTTSSHPSGSKPGKKPQDKRPKKTS